MKRPLISCALLCVVLVSAAARQQYGHVWKRLAPQDEEFVVLMPEPHYRIRREMPFGRGVTLRPASFEVASRGTLFSVLSFARSDASVPRTLPAFVEGFRKALSGNSDKAPASLTFERGLTLDGRAGRQFRLKAGDAEGTARVFETPRHFYVVMALKSAGGDEMVTHFNNSFSLDKSRPPRVSERQTLEALSQTIQAPPPLWPVAGGQTVTIGDRDAAAPGGRSDANRAGAGARPKVVSGGVLNGKILEHVAPTYPAIAKAARAQGTVVVQILVDEEGYIISASAVSGHPLLQQSAVSAVRQWRFTPTLLEGRPVKVSGVVTVNFVLN